MSHYKARCVAGLVALACVFAPVPAQASFFDAYGFNPRAMGMANAQTAVADDFTALYYNPAGMTSRKSGAYGFGLLLSRPSLDLAFDNAEREISALEPGNATAVTFGGMFQLGGDAVKGRIALAFGVAIPTRSLLNGQAVDPAVPHWYMYHSLPERMVAMIGVAALPIDWLSIGVSAQFLAGLEGSLDYELDFVAGRFTRKNVSFDIAPTASLLAGIEIRPIPGARIGVSYRQDIETLVGLPVQLELSGLADLDVQTNFSVQYTPHEISFGASYLLESIDLLISADFTYSLWSEAPDPSVTSRLGVSGDLIEGTLGDSLDAPAEGQERRAPLGFSDILIPRVGVEKGFGDLTVRAGYQLRPSPAPAQSSGSNYVDGTAHHIGFGASLDWQDPWNILTNPLIFDVSGMVALLPARRHEKDDASDVIGSYDASGTIFVAGFAFRYHFDEGKLKEEDPSAAAPTETTAPAPKEAAEPPAPADDPKKDSDSSEAPMPEGEPQHLEAKAQD